MRPLRSQARDPQVPFCFKYTAEKARDRDSAWPMHSERHHERVVEAFVTLNVLQLLGRGFELLRQQTVSGSANRVSVQRIS